MKKTLILLLTLVITTGFIFANGEQETLGSVKTETTVASGTTSDAPLVFKISNGAEPQSLDPHLVNGEPEHHLFMALYEGLVVTDPETGGALPGVAESWDVSDDGLQYTFHLRDCTWSDGVSITAEDVVYSWLRELNPATGGPYAWFPCMFLKGASEYNASEAGPEAVQIRALDEKTFQMDLIGPLPYVLGALCHYAFAIVPEHTIKEFGDKWILPENFVGNGPFELAEWLPQEYIKLTKSDTYWDKDNVKLDEAYFYASDDANTMYNMYLKDEIDWIENIPQEQLTSASLRTDYHVAPMLSTYYYEFNMEADPVDDPLVRKALAMAVDREALVENITQAGQIPSWGIVPPMPGYDGLEFPEEFNVEKAQELLKQAGYPNGSNFPSLELLYNTSDSHKNIAEFIQQQWKENLNINVTLVNQEWATYINSTIEKDYQVARAGWVGDYQDPNSFLDMFLTGGSMNDISYNSAEYDALIKKAATMDAGKERFDTFREAENLLINEDQGIMSLYYYVSTNLIDTDEWGGWYTNTLDYHPIKSIYKK